MSHEIRTPAERHHRLHRPAAQGRRRRTTRPSAKTTWTSSSPAADTSSPCSTTSSTCRRSRPTGWKSSRSAARRTPSSARSFPCSASRPCKRDSPSITTGRAACRKRSATDPSRFRQLLMNLMSNAIKFTKTGGVQVLAEARARQGQSAPRDPGHRHRHRHPRAEVRGHLRSVRAGRHLRDAAARRHRPGTDHQPPHRPGPGRRHHRLQRTGQGQHLHRDHRHRAAGSRGHPGRAHGGMHAKSAKPRSGRCRRWPARTSCWSKTATPTAN